MKRLRIKAKQRRQRKLRVRKKIQGTAERPRLTVFKSNKNIYLQVIDDTVGNTLLSASTLEKELSDLSVNKESAAKIGELISKRCQESKIQQVVFDRNGYKYHGIIQTIADSARKAGLKI